MASRPKAVPAAAPKATDDDPDKGAAKPPAAPKAQEAAEAKMQVDDDKIHNQGMASARLLFRLGEVMSVLMRAPQFRALPLSEVQSLVVPPLAEGQFLIAEARSKSQGHVMPVAAALWATVSKDVDRRLSQALDRPIRLTAKEWKSGDIAWLVVLAGNPKAVAPMLKKFQDTILKGRPLKMRTKGKDGKTVVKTLNGSLATATNE